MRPIGLGPVGGRIDGAGERALDDVGCAKAHLMLRLERKRERDRVDVALAQIAHGGPGIFDQRLRLELTAVA